MKYVGSNISSVEEIEREVKVEKRKDFMRAKKQNNDVDVSTPSIWRIKIIGVIFCFNIICGSLLADKPIEIKSTCGQGFGRVFFIEGIVKKNRYKKGVDDRYILVKKINGDAIKEEIKLHFKVYNDSAKEEFCFFNKLDPNQNLVFIGFENIKGTGVPFRVNGTINTMEQSPRWYVETFFVVVRTSDKISNFPSKRNGIQMNEIRYITYDRQNYNILPKRDKKIDSPAVP